MSTRKIGYYIDRYGLIVFGILFTISAFVPEFNWMELAFGVCFTLFAVNDLTATKLLEVSEELQAVLEKRIQVQAELIATMRQREKTQGERLTQKIDGHVREFMANLLHGRDVQRATEKFLEGIYSAIR